MPSFASLARHTFGLNPVAEDVDLNGAGPIDNNADDASSLGGSNVGSLADGASSKKGSLLNSVVDSVVSDSRKSSQTMGQFSAFTAPPRYRNSGVFVHGSKFKNFKSIMELGLRATDSAIFMIDEVRADGRVPGLRDPPEILIFIDENKARSQNMEFEYDGVQGTWTTKGIGGVIRPWFFQKVVDQRKGPGRGNVLFQSKEDPMMQANVIRGKQRPQYLIHATYWENVYGIMKEGIVPAKNPTSDLRKPFKELLQGAESHVYTVSVPSASSRQRLPSPEIDALGGVRAAQGTLRKYSIGEEDVQVHVDSDEENREALHMYEIRKDLVGLERPPDAFFVIDTQKADALGLKLDMVQCGDREDSVYVQGTIPPELLSQVKPNEPVDLPESLRAKIVDPRSFDEIPIINLEQDDAKCVEQLRYACEVVGFMQVTGHAVSTDLQQRHMNFQKDFFRLPDAVKKRLALDESSPVRGWFGKGGEDLDQVLEKQVDAAGLQKIASQSRKDHKEALDTNGVPWAKPVGGYVAGIFGQPSRFPTEEELPGFREVMEEYSSEMFKLARRLLSLMAQVLDKPPDFFEQYITDPVATHRILHYWPIKDFSSEIGVGEHTDYGLLTLLKQDSVGGLQVLNAKDGRWVHCCPVDNAFVVNLGDMMSRWTAHRFKSTVHRVVNVSTRERFSVPYFLEPNMDAEIVNGALVSAPCSESPDDNLTEHQRRCRLRRAWKETRDCGGESDSPGRKPGGNPDSESATAEDILERFYRASGQLKFAPPDSKQGSPKA